MLVKKISKKLGYVFASLVLMTAQMTPFFVFGGRAYADGNGSSDACKSSVSDNVVSSIGGEDNGQSVDLVTYDVGAGNLVEGVCIKSGSSMFGGNQHSGVLPNGTYEGNCYVVAGVGTQVATVTRIGNGNDCQGISHIDVVVKPKTGSITIEKNAVNDSIQEFKFSTINLSTDATGFTLVDDSTPGLPSKVFNDINAGVYTVEELDTEDWYLDDITCSSTLGSDATEVDSKVTIDLKQGDDVKCVFKNRERDVPQVNFCDPSQRPAGMGIGEWLSANDVKGSDCFEFVVTQRCGYLDVAFTKNLTGYNYEFRYKIGSTTPGVGAWEGDGTLPKSFDEDFNGGSVEVTYYIVGEESDYFRGFGMPNVWDGNGVTVTVDTDCIEPEPATLRLEKTVINDDNGTLNADQFGISISGFSTPVFGNSTSTNGDTKVYQTSSTFPAFDGDIVISENDTTGYSEGTWMCSNGVNGSGLSVTINLKAGDDVTCKITNNDNPPVIIVATKIVCDDETKLPGYGNSGPDITSTTAIDWVTGNAGCELAEGWNFEYAFNNAANPGDNSEDTAWTDFGPTDSGGKTRVEFDDVSDVNRIWVREQLKDGYLGFTFNSNNQTNVDAISAELYCHRDVLNYDNYDFIDRPVLDNTYYCVAWNVEEKGSVEVTKFNDENNNGEWDEGEETLSDWEMNLTPIEECEEYEEYVSIYDEEDDNPIDCEEPETIEKDTNSEGVAVFENVKSGWYVVGEDDKAGWDQTVIYCDDERLDFARLSNDEDETTRVIWVGAGQTIKCYIGNYDTPGGGNPEPETGTIIVTKFNDVNKNKVWDKEDGEIALEGWEITIERNGVKQSKTTGINGTVTFTDLELGNYKVSETPQDGWDLSVNFCNDNTKEECTVGAEVPVECFIGNYKTTVPEEPVTPPSVLGVTTPPVVLATTGDNQSSYMFATGLTLIAATLVVATNRRRETVSTK